MSVEEILAALQAIIDGAGDQPLTDEQAERYEELERDLAVARRNVEIRSRQQAYTTPVRNDLHVHVGTARQDDTLDRAFNHYLRTGRANQDLVELRAQEAGENSEGGYTVPPGFRQKLVEVQKAFGGFAQEAENVTTSSGEQWRFPSLDDTANEGAITDEEAAFADGDDLAFGNVELPVYKYTSTGTGTTTPLRVSVELLQDSAFDIAGLVARALGTRIARKQARDWINGTGTTLPVGVLNDTTITPDASLDTPGTLAYADLIDLEGLLDPAYEQNAQWLMNKATWVTVRKIVDGDQRPLVIDSAASGMRTQPEKTLFGYRVVLDQMSPSASGGTGVNFIGFGDWRESYVIRHVQSTTVVVDPYTRAINGQVQYVAWERAGGNVQNRSAYKVLRG